MKPIQQYSFEDIEQGRIDGVKQIQTGEDEPPAIVSISDIHGHIERARSALTTLNDRPEHDPVVIPGNGEQLQWADENYVLVFNGDLTDRGDDNEAVLRMVSRLAAQAPPGRVRVTLGNHEAIALSADHYPYDNWYAGRADEQDRRALLNAIRSGLVVAAYRGYNYTYAHAGASDAYDVSAMNHELRLAAEELSDALGTNEDVDTQRAVISDYPRVLGVGDGRSPKSEGAGLVWLDMRHLSPDAPPQVIGHTKSETPQQKGEVICQNVILENERNDSPGGETVFVENPDRIVAITRGEEGGTRQQQY
jgi:Calcineurin-like phosphoesterase.